MNFVNESLTSSDSDIHHAAHNIFKQFMSSKDNLVKVQFVLDPSVMHEVIAAEQKIPGTLKLLLSITTTYVVLFTK